MAMTISLLKINVSGRPIAVSPVNFNVHVMVPPVVYPTPLVRCFDDEIHQFVVHPLHHNFIE
jgi:hypothetical protein